MATLGSLWAKRDQVAQTKPQTLPPKAMLPYPVLMAQNHPAQAEKPLANLKCS
jgi:hypothetical protein